MLRWFECALLVVVCWQAAGVFWLAFAPATDRAVLSMPRQRADDPGGSPDAVLRWYGAGDGSPVRVAGDLSLVAVIAGKQGAAVLKGSDGVGVALRLGDEIRPGSRLLAVDPSGITIEQGGARQEILFPQTGARRGLVQSANEPAGTVGTAKPVRITRGQMVAALRESNVGAWDAGLSPAPGGGIRVAQVSRQPFARLLGFADGDVIRHINQRPLLQVADISLISHYFGQHTSVTIGLLRQGTAVTRVYEIQP